VWQLHFLVLLNNSSETVSGVTTEEGGRVISCRCDFK